MRHLGVERMVPLVSELPEATAQTEVAGGIERNFLPATTLLACNPPTIVSMAEHRACMWTSPIERVVHCRLALSTGNPCARNRDP